MSLQCASDETPVDRRLRRHRAPRRAAARRRASTCASLPRDDRHAIWTGPRRLRLARAGADAVLHCAPPPPARTTRHPHREPARRAREQADSTNPLRLHQHQRRLRRLRRRAVDESRPVQSAEPTRARGASTPRQRLALWCSARGVCAGRAARARHLRGRSAAARAAARRHAGAARRKTTSTPITSTPTTSRPSACARCDDAAPAGHLQRLRRQRDQDGRLVRPGRRPRRPAAPAAHRARAKPPGRMPPELLSFMSESRRLDNTGA